MNHDFEGKSSTLKSCHHDGTNLHVIFHNGGTYIYKDCGVDHFHGMKDGESAGKYFRNNVMDKFEHEKS